MIKIFLLDFTGAEERDFSAPAIPGYPVEGKNETVRRERFFSALLLSHAYKTLFFKDIGDVERDAYGRPQLKSGEIDFNISHSENLSAVIISDEGRVGIDVEKITDRVSERLIEKTERSSFEVSCGECVMPILLKAEGGKIISVPLVLSEQKSSFFEKWTLREALSKADGRGLSFINRIKNEEFLLISQIRIYVGEEEYAVSAVKKRGRRIV